MNKEMHILVISMLVCLLTACASISQRSDKSHLILRKYTEFERSLEWSKLPYWSATYKVNTTKHVLVYVNVYPIDDGNLDPEKVKTDTQILKNQDQLIIRVFRVNDESEDREVRMQLARLSGEKLKAIGLEHKVVESVNIPTSSGRAVQIVRIDNQEVPVQYIYVNNKMNSIPDFTENISQIASSIGEGLLITIKGREVDLEKDLQK